jgi:uncharacterized protein
MKGGLMPAFSFTMDAEQLKSFKEKLDQQHAWPVLFTFKFIVPQNKAQEVRQLFPKHEAQEKASGKGNYISFTYQMMMPSSDAVIEVYQKAAVVEGILSL